MRSARNPDKFDELCASIKKLGILQPLLLKRVGKEYEVVAGDRRFKAAQHIGLKAVPAHICDTAGTANELAKFAENHFREDVTAEDEAKWMVNLREERKLTNASLAKLLSLPASYCSEHCAILEYPDYVKEKIADGNLSFSSARELHRISDPVARLNFMTAAAQSGISPSEAKRWRTDFETGKLAADANPNAGYNSPAPQPLPEVRGPCDCCNKMVVLNKSRLIRVCAKCEEDMLPTK